MATKDLVCLSKRTPKERSEIAKKGAEASAQVRREKRDLKGRISLMLDVMANKATEGKSKEERELIKEIGFEVYELMNLLYNTHDPDKRLKVLSEIMDRTDGKAIQKQEIKGEMLIAPIINDDV